VLRRCFAAALAAAAVTSPCASGSCSDRPGSRPYHHGDLRRALLEEAVRLIAESGLPALRLRELARRIGVSHAAPAHHFGDKPGLLTAVAADGFGLLAAELRAAYESTGSFLEVGVAYVRFATRHPAHFQVMFRPELYRRDDPELAAAREQARAMLYGPVAERTGERADANVLAAGVAAWSLAHGLATLLLNGALPRPLADDPEAAARRILTYLFQGDEGEGRG
jgi:AcrR family transcriptional regulator